MRDWYPDLIKEIEMGRAEIKKGFSPRWNSPNLNSYLSLYDDRASLRVADILSVLARDACLWRIAAEIQPDLARIPIVRDLLIGLRKKAELGPNFEGNVLAALDDSTVWGDL